MDFILSYNNREKVMVFPVVPNDMIVLNRGQGNQTFDSVSGEMQALGPLQLASFELESIFPLHQYRFMRPGSTTDGWDYVRTIEAVRARRIPFRGIHLDNQGREIFNLPLSVDSFEYRLDQAGDISYRISFREYRFAEAPLSATLPAQREPVGRMPTTVPAPLTAPLTDSQVAAEESFSQMTMRSGAVVTAGRTIVIPAGVKQTGAIASMTYWREPKKGKSWAAGTTQRALFDLWSSSGKTVANAIAVLNGCYLIATTLTFGNVGDGVCVFFENGKMIKCIIGDSKGANVANSPHPGETGNQYGHAYGSSGVDVIEWEYGNPRVGTNQANGDKLRAGLRAMGIYGCKVIKMINFGSWLNQ